MRVLIPNHAGWPNAKGPHKGRVEPYLTGKGGLPLSVEVDDPRLQMLIAFARARHVVELRGQPHTPLAPIVSRLPAAPAESSGGMLSRVEHGEV